MLKHRLTLFCRTALKILLIVLYHICAFTKSPYDFSKTPCMYVNLSIYLQVYSPLSSISTSEISRLEINSILLEGKKNKNIIFDGIGIWH